MTFKTLLLLMDIRPQRICETILYYSFVDNPYFTSCSHLQVNRQSRERIPIHLSKSEIADYVKRFNSLDTERKGYISLNDLRRSLKVGLGAFSGVSWRICNVYYVVLSPEFQFLEKVVILNEVF